MSGQHGFGAVSGSIVADFKAGLVPCSGRGDYNSQSSMDLDCRIVGFLCVLDMVVVGGTFAGMVASSLSRHSSDNQSTSSDPG